MLPVQIGFCDVPHVYCIMLPVQGGFCNVPLVYSVLLPVRRGFVMCLVCTVYVACSERFFIGLCFAFSFV